jgi:hypothetical protein
MWLNISGEICRMKAATSGSAVPRTRIGFLLAHRYPPLLSLSLSIARQIERKGRHQIEHGDGWGHQIEDSCG